MVDWYIGTMGFGYKDWNRVFYPADLSPRDYLAYYSQVFSGVEVDSTFYGTPRKSSVLQWERTTPNEFRFCLKMPRVITHEVIKIGARALMEEFVEAVRLLGEKLGVLLFQFPPSFQVDQLPFLEKVLSGLPDGVRYAIEVRHPSWFIVDETLHEPIFANFLRHFGVCWAATEYPGLPRRIHLTADFLYIRWIGRHGTYRRHNHERVDQTPQLLEWLTLIRGFENQVKNIYGFFNNDYAGFAAGTAIRFMKIAGFSVRQPETARQESLF